MIVYILTPYYIHVYIHVLVIFEGYTLNRKGLIKESTVAAGGQGYFGGI